MWNSKIGESKACAIADPANPSLQLAEGTSVKGTARLTRVSREAIRRLASQLGRQADPANPSLGFHDQRVQQLASTSLQADERWGFARSKREQLWQAEVIDLLRKSRQGQLEVEDASDQPETQSQPLPAVAVTQVRTLRVRQYPEYL